MPYDKIDELYDALHEDGAVQKDRKNFRRYMSDRKNRETLYNALHEDGAVQSASFDEFNKKLGVSEEDVAKEFLQGAPTNQNTQNPLSAQTGNVQQPAQQTEKPTGNVVEQAKAVAQQVVPQERWPTEETASKGTTASGKKASISVGMTLTDDERSQLTKEAAGVWKQAYDKAKDGTNPRGAVQEAVMQHLIDKTGDSQMAKSILDRVNTAYVQQLGQDDAVKFVAQLPDDLTPETLQTAWIDPNMQMTLHNSAAQMSVNKEDYVSMGVKPALKAALQDKYGVNFDQAVDTMLPMRDYSAVGNLKDVSVSIDNQRFDPKYADNPLGYYNPTTKEVEFATKDFNLDFATREKNRKRYEELMGDKGVQLGFGDRFAVDKMGEYNPKTGKYEPVYYSSDGLKFNNRYDAGSYQKGLDAYNEAYRDAINKGEIPDAFGVEDWQGNYAFYEDIKAQKDGAHETAEGFNRRLDRKINYAQQRLDAINKAIEKDNNENGNPLLSYSATVGGGNGASEARIQLGISKSEVEDELRYLETVRNRDDHSNIWLGLKNTVGRARQWDFGITDFALMGQMERMRNKINGKQPLTREEEELAKSYLGRANAAALEDEYMGQVYRAVKIGGQSLPYMLDFVLTGGFGGVSKWAARQALKFAINRNLPKIAAGLIKNTGVIAGDIFGATELALTEQILKTGADVMQRHVGTLYLDDNGQYRFGTFGAFGELQHEGGEDFITAVNKGIGAAMVENYTEKVFGHNYGIKRAIANGLEAAGANGFVALGRNFSKALEPTKKALERAGINGLFEEIMEEEINIPLNWMVVGDNNLTDLLDEDQQGDIVYGMLFSIGSSYAIGLALSNAGRVANAAVNLPSQAYNTAAYYNMRHKVDKWDAMLTADLGAQKWAPIRDRIDATDNGEMVILAHEIWNDGTLSTKERNQISGYMGRLMLMRGYNFGSFAAVQAKDQGTGVSDNDVLSGTVSQSYSEGYEVTASPAERHQAKQAYDTATAAVSDLVTPETLANLNADPIATLHVINNDGNWTAEDKQTVLDYVNAKAKYDGIIQRVRDDIDTKVAESDVVIDGYTHQDSGMVVRAAMRERDDNGNNKAYHIVSGDVAMNADGVGIDVANSSESVIIRDEATGELQMIAPTDLVSVEDAIPAGQVKQEAADAIRQTMATQAAAEIDGETEQQGTPVEQENATATQAEPSPSEAIGDNQNGPESAAVPAVDVTALQPGETVTLTDGTQAEVIEMGSVNNGRKGQVQLDVPTPPQGKSRVDWYSTDEVAALTQPVEAAPVQSAPVKQQSAPQATESTAEHVLESSAGGFSINTPFDFTVYGKNGRSVHYTTTIATDKTDPSDGLRTVTFKSVTDDSKKGVRERPNGMIALSFDDIDYAAYAASGRIGEDGKMMKAEDATAEDIEEAKQMLIDALYNPVSGKTMQPRCTKLFIAPDGKVVAELLLSGDTTRVVLNNNPLERMQETTPAHKYKAGDKFTTSSGYVQTVEGIADDGRYSVRTFARDGTDMGVSEMSEEMLENGLDDGRVAFTPAESAQTNLSTSEGIGGNQTSSESTTETTATEKTTPTAVSAENAPTALERIPKDTNGEPIYEQATPDLAWDGLVEQTEGDEAMAKEVADDMVKDKEAALKKAQKQTPKQGSTIAEKIAERKRIKADIDKAQADLDHWKAIAGEQTRRENEQRAAEQQAVEERRRQEEAERKARAEEVARQKAEAEEAARKEREAVQGVPEWQDDKPADARARGFRRSEGHKYDRQDPIANKVEGNETEVRFAEGEKGLQKGRMAVIEADSAQPSHTSSGQRNVLHFITEAQPKERTDAASQQSQEKIASSPRFGELTTAQTAYTGMPAVNLRGESIQGNNRLIALKLMYDQHPEQAAAYKQYLVEHAAEFGMDAEAISKMENPILTNMLPVSDNRAIELGQYTATDTESGGNERIKPEHTMQKLGTSGMQSVARMLLQSDDPDMTISQLIEQNGIKTLKWLNMKHAITDTQIQTAAKNGTLTGEGREDLQKLLQQGVILGGVQDLPAMFGKLPAKAQRAIMQTAFRDYDSSETERMLPEIQASIQAYYELQQDGSFMAATNYEDARRAVLQWSKQYQLDMAGEDGQSFLPSEKYSNFALTLAAMYKGQTQTGISQRFNDMYDYIQGKASGGMTLDFDGDGEANKPHTLAEAIKHTLNIDYNGKERSNVVADNDSASTERGQGSPSNTGGGEQSTQGEQPADGGNGVGTVRETGREVSGGSEGGIREVHEVKRLSSEEAENLLTRMEEKAESAPQLTLTPETWAEQFGEDGTVATPIGKVKMGSNQIVKLFEKGRSEQFGMIKPTLENPDVIIEEASEAKDGASERPTSYVFVKTFDRNGEKIKYFASITVQKDGMEVSISSHYMNRNAVAKKMQESGVFYTREALLPNSSDGHLAEHQDGVPDLLPTQGNNASSEDNVSSDGKVNQSSSNSQENGEKNSSSEDEKQAEQFGTQLMGSSASPADRELVKNAIGKTFFRHGRNPENGHPYIEKMTIKASDKKGMVEVELNTASTGGTSTESVANIANALTSGGWKEAAQLELVDENAPVTLSEMSEAAEQMQQSKQANVDPAFDFEHMTLKKQAIQAYIRAEELIREKLGLPTDVDRFDRRGMKIPTKGYRLDEAIGIAKTHYNDIARTQKPEPATEKQVKYINKLIGDDDILLKQSAGLQYNKLQASLLIDELKRLSDIDLRTTMSEIDDNYDRCKEVFNAVRKSMGLPPLAEETEEAAQTTTAQTEKPKREDNGDTKNAKRIAENHDKKVTHSNLTHTQYIKDEGFELGQHVTFKDGDKQVEGIIVGVTRNGDPMLLNPEGYTVGANIHWSDLKAMKPRTYQEETQWKMEKTLADYYKKQKAEGRRMSAERAESKEQSNAGAKTEQKQEEPKAEEKKQSESTSSKKSSFVLEEDADRFEELRKRLQAKLRGQMNMGVDPEIFAIGVEMSYLMLKKGARQFADFAKNLIETLGEEVRPYVKSFYNGARDLPEMEEYAKDMTPYEEVRKFDVTNLGKEKPATSMLDKVVAASNEEKVRKQTEKVKKEVEQTVKDNRKIANGTIQLRPATTEELRDNVPVYHDGKRVYIMALMEHGAQTGVKDGVPTFSEPTITSVYLTNGKNVKPEELMVEDTHEMTFEEAVNNFYDGSLINQEALEEAVKDADQSVIFDIITFNDPYAFDVKPQKAKADLIESLKKVSDKTLAELLGDKDASPELRKLLEAEKKNRHDKKTTSKDSKSEKKGVSSQPQQLDLFGSIPDTKENDAEKKTEKVNGIQTGETKPTTKPVEQLTGDSAEKQAQTTDEHKFVQDVADAILKRAKFCQEQGINEPLTMNDIKKIVKQYPSLEDVSATDMQELVERAMTTIVRKATQEDIAKNGRMTKAGYDAVVRLYETQPLLNARDSTRVERQQYSTPTPFGWLMGQFIKNGKDVQSVLEPSAGNGALTIAFDPALVHVNDIDDRRLANLRTLGFGIVTAQNGLLPFDGEQVDAMLTNPPFGSIETKTYGDVYKIGSLEGQMAINGLDAMKDDGRAAIIIGGNTEYRANGIMMPKDMAFFGYLYNHYNVVDVINLDGAMYARNGTKYPVRMILIDGRKSDTSTRVYPPVKAKGRAEQVHTFDELYNRVNDDILRIQQNPNNVGSRDEAIAVTNGGTRQSNSVQRNRNNTGAGTKPVQSSSSVGTPQSSRLSTTTRGERGTAERPELQTSTPRVDNDHRGDAGSAGVVQSKPSSATSGQRGARASAEPRRTGGTELGNVPSQPQTSGKRLAVSLTDEKVAYPNRSQSATLMSVVPAAQAEVLAHSLSEIGDVDQFLVDNLGYANKDELFSHLAAEQVDSIALAIHQMGKGDAFIIGDMTGVGKGRQGAALIRYAVHQGKKPIYFTQKPMLFADNYRDLCDIGSSNLRPFIIASSSDGVITDAKGNVVHKLPTKKEVERVFDYINEHGTLPDEYDYVLCTYSQIQNGTEDYEIKGGNVNKKAKSYPKGKSATAADFSGQRRRDAIAQLVKDNILILDESHTAGGSGGGARFMQYCMQGVSGCTFLSATYAKRPDNMPIYAMRTDLSKAGVSMEEMIEAIQRGGVTFEEIMSKQLVQSGQMIRRERSFEGVNIDWLQVDEVADKKQRAQFDEVANIFGAIRSFQDEFISPLVQNRSEELAEVASYAGIKQGTKAMGVDNVPFASKMYNLVNQLLFALKADAVADRAIWNLQHGFKPVISFKNTMEGFLEDAVKDVPMDEIPNFSLTLMRALDGVMRYTETDSFGNKESHEYSVNDLTPEGAARYNEIRKQILELSADLPISPMDAIKIKLRDAGYTVEELTGRTTELVKDENGKYVVRNRAKADKKAAARNFNSGKTDVLLLNNSASTGISLHASTRVADQRQRVMIFAQFQSDINDEVQMRGRIDRTGQVSRGKYEYIMSSIPAEQRLQMMFKAKLKSLDANTTSSQKSKFNEMEVVDFLNKYGDEVVWSYMQEHPELEEKLGDPLKMLAGKDGESEDKAPRTRGGEDSKPTDDAAGKVCRYLPFLPVKEQEEIFKDITEAYAVKMQLLNDAGENDLEITTMPLRAETKNRKIWAHGTAPGSGNSFADNTYLEEVEVDVLKKPMKADEVRKLADRLTDGKPFDEWRKEKQDAIKQAYNDKVAALQTKAEAAAKEKAQKAKEKYIESARKYREAGKNTMTDAEIETMSQTAYNTVIEEAKKKFSNQKEQIGKRYDGIYKMLNKFDQLEMLAIPMNIGEKDYGTTFIPSFGTFVGFKLNKDFSPSSSTAVFATLDGRRKVELPLKEADRLQTIKTNTMMQSYAVRNMTMENWNDRVPTSSRKKAYIVTGNLMKALVDTQKEAKTRGYLISYSTIDGETRQGILMKDSFEEHDLRQSAPISSKLVQIRDEYEKVVSEDGKVTVEYSKGWPPGYAIRVPKSKQSGGVYFLDKPLRKLVDGGDFTTKGNNMVGIIRYHDKENLAKALDRLSKLGVTVSVEAQLKDEKPGKARKQKVDGKQHLTPAETALRDALNDEVRIGGTEVVVDSEAGQWMLDNENGGDSARYEKVTDKKELEHLNSGKTFVMYSTLQDIDGMPASPMSGYTRDENGKLVPTNLVEEGAWLRADEATFDLTTEQLQQMKALEESGKKGDVVLIPNKLRYHRERNGGKIAMQFLLQKTDNPSDNLWVSYNPYNHTSTSMLNDQFTGAYARSLDGNKLFIAKWEIPEDEKTSSYQAQWAASAEGFRPWHSGVVNALLPKDKQRGVMLSRHRKMVGRVSDAEAAATIVKQIEDSGVPIPYNTMWKELVEEVAKLGYPISTIPSGSVTAETQEAFNQQMAELKTQYPQAKFVNLKVTREGYKEWGGKVHFFKTKNGEAYGFTIGGKIYIDPRIATAETPIHEYSHLWAEALRYGNPKEWKNVVKLMKGTTIWDEVKQRYPELKTDDEIADEVLAHYSGRRGAERLREEHRKAMESNASLNKKAAALSAIERVRQALKRFWKATADFLHIHYKSAEEVADRVMSDMLNHVNPNEVTKERKAKADKEYAEAVAAGDKKKVHYMVLQAAKEAMPNTKVVDRWGKPKVVYHGTPHDSFTVFNDGTIFFSDSRGIGEEYRHKRGGLAASMFPTGHNMPCFINIENPLEIDAHNRNWDNISVDWTDERVSTEDIARYAKENGYDGVIIKNVRDGVTIYPSDPSATVYVAFDPSQVKSAGPTYGQGVYKWAKEELLNEVGATYDDNGNLIPLSERFNSNSNDIRYQFTGERGAAAADHAEEVTTRIDNLGVAREMEAAKKDAKAIKLATGWERGADGKWRYEMPDGEINQEAPVKREDDYWTVPLQELWKNEGLFKSYPELKGITVCIQELPLGTEAAYHPISKVLTLSKGFYSHDEQDAAVKDEIRAIEETPEYKEYAQWYDKSLRDEYKGRLQEWNDKRSKATDEFFNSETGKRYYELKWGNNTPKHKEYYFTPETQSVLAHEVQHAIQHIEGFAKGGNVNTVRRQIEDIISSERGTTEYAARQYKNWALLNRLANQLEASRVLAKDPSQDAQDTAYYLYWEAMDEIDNNMDDKFKLVNDYASEFGEDYDTRDIAMSGYHVDEAIKELRDAANEYRAEFQNNRASIDLVNKLEKFLQEDNASLYTRLTGEVESRNVQKRMNMTPEERRQSLASETEDVSREDQIFLFGEGGESASIVLDPKRAKFVDVKMTQDDYKKWGIGTDDGKGRKKIKVGETFSKDNQSFDNVRDRAVRETGIVLPNLAEQEVKIVDVATHHFEGATDEEKADNARKWGEEHLVTEGKATLPQMKDGTPYAISKGAIGKYTNYKTINNSESIDAHLSVMTVLPDVIANSVEAEIHPDYHKNKAGDRKTYMGHTDNVLVHRLYGAVNIDGKVYRVKTTMQEFRGKNPNRPHSFEVTDIKLLDYPATEVLPNSDQLDPSNSSISGAKLLQKVGKSYEPWKDLLDESQTLTNGEEYFRSGEGYDIGDGVEIPIMPNGKKPGEVSPRYDGSGYEVYYPYGKRYEDYRVDHGAFHGVFDSLHELEEAAREQYPTMDVRVIGEEGDPNPVLSIKPWPQNEPRKYSARERREREAYGQRVRQQAIAKVKELAAKLHLDNVEIVEDKSTLEGKRATAKGFFNPKTGKITIVLDNHRSVGDVVKTLLHEAVAHYGLRQLVGDENFNTFLDNVYKVAKERIKNDIDAIAERLRLKDIERMAKRKGGGMKAHAEAVMEAEKKRVQYRHTATEEYMAKLAEDTDFENAEKSGWWNKIKTLFSELFKRLGLKNFEYFFYDSITDNELRYILWRSYKNLTGEFPSVFKMAEDIVMQDRLHVGNFSEERSVKSEELETKDDGRVGAISASNQGQAARTSSVPGRKGTTNLSDVQAEDDVLFRDGDPEEHERGMARASYEHMVSTGWYQVQEAMQDSMLGLEKGMKAILQSRREWGKGKHIEDVADFENPYLGENALSSKNQDEAEQYNKHYMRPLLDEVKKLAKNADERAELTDYMMAKHGLERNEVMAHRDADKAWEAYQKSTPNGKQTWDDFYADAREKDYAGLTALTQTDNVADAEAEAQNMVAAYEQAHDVQPLWDAVNAATKATLEKTYKSGMMSKATFDDISSMYQNYIPLRGFDETTAEDAYAYLNHRDSVVNAPIKTTKGRKSKADDPFANIASMAETAIMQGNRNTMVKQRALNFALNHPSDLISVSDLWLHYDKAGDEWVPVFPGNIEDTDTPDVVEQKMKDFETKMAGLQQQYPNEYKHGRDAVGVPYRVVQKHDKQQHQVIVKRNGRDYILTVNGNPRMAQALNGQTNPDNDLSGAIGKIIGAAEAVNRGLASVYTTRNPNFVASNFLRDELYANAVVWVKESPAYAARFNGNAFICNPATMKWLLGRDRKGKLNLNNLLERYYNEFMRNGGETGFTSLRDIETHKKEILKELKRGGLKAKWKALGIRLDELNRAVENAARFTAYVTSRQMGRSVGRSIWDAKEISVNFNKKGAGSKFMGATGQTAAGNTAAFTSGLGRSLYVFWNAAIQGSFGNFFKVIKRHPLKSAVGAIAAPFALGLVMGMIGYGGDDDDEKNKYANLPKTTRRQNICFKTGDQYVTIPLPTEVRAIYGMGELAASVMLSPDPIGTMDIAKEITEQFSQVLPIDFMEGGGGFHAFVPSSVKPIVEVANNESWTGLPIYNDSEFQKNLPEWRKAYKSANTQILGATKWLNEITGGDDATKGAVDINPAQIEYLLNGYFSGYWRFGDQLVKSGETMLQKRDFDWRNVPLANRVVKSADERNAYKNLNNVFYRYMEDVDKVQTQEREYKKVIENQTASDEKHAEYLQKLTTLVKSDDYVRTKAFEEISNAVSELNKAYKQTGNTDIERAMYELKSLGVDLQRGDVTMQELQNGTSKKLRDVQDALSKLNLNAEEVEDK